MIAVTARRILTLLARVAPAPGRPCRDGGRTVGRVTGREAGGTGGPDAVVFRHYL